MGMFWVPCSQCGETFGWFSGNIHQICGKCINGRGRNISGATEVKHVATGEFVEVGQLIESEGTMWPAIALRIDGVSGSPVVYIPVNWPEAKKLAPGLYDRVSITIETAVDDSQAETEGEHG